MASAEPTEGRCGALIRKGDQAGMYCTKAPMKGQARCGSHGGKAPQAIAAASKRIAEQQMAQAVHTLGLRRDISPEDALLEEIEWAAGHVQWLRQQVQALEPDALVWGLTESKDVGSGEFGGVDRTEAAQPSTWWVLYERERKYLLALIHEAGVQKIEDRRVRLAERQGTQLAERGRAYIAGVIDALHLDQAAAPVMQRLFADMLRSLAGGPLAVTS
jgi:hypothetical protein